MDVTLESRRSAGSRGFILAMLLAVITAMGILLTMALPNIKTEVQREEEAELVFRGQAIANAIRAYKAKTGGYPLALTDLTKVSPRIIRRLYTDPMTKDGEWQLMTAVQPGASGDLTGLPIVGVRSKCQKDSFLIYKGKSLISDWLFSAGDNLLGLPAGAADAAALAGVSLPGTVGGARGNPSTGGGNTSTGGSNTPGIIPPAIGNGSTNYGNANPQPTPPAEPPAPNPAPAADAPASNPAPAPASPVPTPPPADAPAAPPSPTTPPANPARTAPPANPAPN